MVLHMGLADSVTATFSTYVADLASFFWASIFVAPTNAPINSLESIVQGWTPPDNVSLFPNGQRLGRARQAKSE